MRKNIAFRIEESVNRLDGLNDEIRFTREKQLFLCEHFEPLKLSKNDFLLREGEIEKYFYFVECGILRYWTSDGPDREAIIRFAMEGEYEKEILLSVPLKYIASYLGIAPQTLSRVRKMRN